MIEAKLEFSTWGEVHIESEFLPELCTTVFYIKVTGNNLREVKDKAIKFIKSLKITEGNGDSKKYYIVAFLKIVDSIIYQLSKKDYTWHRSCKSTDGPGMWIKFDVIYDFVI